LATIHLEIVNSHAYVIGQISINGRPVLPAIHFIVDTAASRSFICPSDEIRLLANRPDLRNNFIKNGIDHVHTMLGDAPVKSLSVSPNALDLMFLDIKGTEVMRRIDYLYFSDGSRSIIPKFMKRCFGRRNARVWDHAGQDLPHSILGCDVLKQFSMLLVPQDSYGLLTTVDHASLIQQVEHPTSLIRGVTEFNERRNFKDLWIRE
jgi:hypothetical protein